MANDEISRLLRGVLAQNNDCASSTAMFGAGATREQRDHAEAVARHAYRRGYVEATIRPYDDLLRIRVTEGGRAYLAQGSG